MGSVRFLHFVFGDSRSAPISTLIDDLFIVRDEYCGPLSTMQKGSSLAIDGIATN